MRALLISTLLVAVVGWLAGLGGLALHYTESGSLRDSVAGMRLRVEVLEDRLRVAPADVLARVQVVDQRTEAIYRMLDPGRGGGWRSTMLERSRTLAADLRAHDDRRRAADAALARRLDALGKACTTAGPAPVEPAP